MPTLIVGNTASKIKGKEIWRCTLYVRGNIEFIDYVDLGLHPTFAKPIRTLAGPCFEYQSQCWGTFPVTVIVFWKGGGSSVTKWDLQFTADANKELDVPESAVAVFKPSVSTKIVKGSASAIMTVKQFFNIMDRNGDGTLDIAEFAEFWGEICSLNSSITGEEIKRLFTSLDRNGDGVISIDETVDYIFTSKEKAKLIQGAIAATPSGRARHILHTGDVRLLSAHWLVTQPISFRIKRHQDLPGKAFLPTEKAESLLSQERGVVVISYPWLTKEHPDPNRFHLETVLDFLRCLGKMRSLNEVGIFWDFASLPQPPRTKREDQAFKRGLKAIDLLYGGKMSIVVQLKDIPEPHFEGMNSTPYNRRGWCVFEEAVSSILKDNDKVWNLSNVSKELKSGETYKEVLCAAVSLRQPPVPPQQFCEQLESLVFTSGADRVLVGQIYTDFFNKMCVCAASLTFSNPWNWITNRIRSWGPKEAEQLAQALPSFRACEILCLNCHLELGTGEGAAELLVTALARLPQLRQLLMSGCGLRDDFLIHLANCPTSLPRLQHLWLGDPNYFSGDGLSALAAGLERLPSLVDLQLPADIQFTKEAECLRVAWVASGRSLAGLNWA